MEQVEEGPDEGDDEGGDDDEEEEVIVTETEVVAASVDCLRRSGTCHTDDAKNLGGNVNMQYMVTEKKEMNSNSPGHSGQWTSHLFTPLH